jgi:hypothetical protein
VDKVLVGIGHLLGLHQVGVVADGEEVEAVGDVVAVLREARRRQVLEVRAVELLEQVLAVRASISGPLVSMMSQEKRPAAPR